MPRSSNTSRLTEAPLARCAAAALGFSLLAGAPLAATAHDDSAATTPPPAEVEKPAEKPVEKSPEELAKEAAKKEIEAMQQEIQRLNTENQLLLARQKASLTELELERSELQTRTAVESARLEADLAALKNEVSRLQTESQHARARQSRDGLDAELMLERRALENRVEGLRLEGELQALRAESQRLQTENALRQEEVKRAQFEAQLAKQRYDAQIAEFRSQLDLRGVEDQFLSRVVSSVDRIENPLDGTTLYVSDRRIPMNGPIMSGSANFVCDRIDFFNNQSQTEPIFIVIDYCPGGSVMEGYRIVKAVETSRAPIHVVVKSFAASMAAVITTLAPHSYALPNAIILHHQMSSGMSGNLTQQRERLERGMEWSRRLAGPVAEKMGISEDEFVRRMYENDSNGDWEEFADGAKELNWVQHIVHEIRETGLRDQPTGRANAMPMWMEAMEYDDKGNPFIKLPPLMPFDHYFMHNPDNFWR